MNSKRSIMGIIISLSIAVFTMLVGSDGTVLIRNVPLFMICGALVFLIHWIVFIPSYAFKTEHYFDITGSISYISVVALAWVLNPYRDLRTLILAILIIVWAMRLGAFLFLRVKRVGKDIRFDKLKHNFLSFAMVWTLSGLWVILTAAAGLSAMVSTKQKDLDIFAIVGLMVWLIGFGVEVLADLQKDRFRANQENQNAFISTGLWAWSRHPNYFGEIVLWFGIAIIAFPVLTGWQYLTLLSPVFVFFLITKISGIPLLEAKAEKMWGANPKYVAYRDVTPPLFLRRPKV